MKNVMSLAEGIDSLIPSDWKKGPSTCAQQLSLTQFQILKTLFDPKSREEKKNTLAQTAMVSICTSNNLHTSLVYSFFLSPDCSVSILFFFCYYYYYFYFLLDTWMCFFSRFVVVFVFVVEPRYVSAAFLTMEDILRKRFRISICFDETIRYEWQEWEKGITDEYGRVRVNVLVRANDATMVWWCFDKN